MLSIYGRYVLYSIIIKNSRRWMLLECRHTPGKAYVYNTITTNQSFSMSYKICSCIQVSLCQHKSIYDFTYEVKLAKKNVISYVCSCMNIFQPCFSSLSTFFPQCFRVTFQTMPDLHIQEHPLGIVMNCIRNSTTSVFLSFLQSHIFGQKQKSLQICR